VAFIEVDLASDVEKVEVARVIAYHHIGDVSYFKEALVIDRNWEDVNVFAIFLQRRQIGLQKPLYTDISHCWVVEFTTAYAEIVLKHEQEAVLF
jgi:hypothetical protein